VIYCVHGKPSAGCCTVLESEVIDIQAGDYVSTPTRENQDASDFSKKIIILLKISHVWIMD
jgi:hypothetical protein